jgi:dTDP-4-dehydrorhamnose reductase
MTAGGQSILIVGGDGMIGGAVAARFIETGHRTWATTRRLAQATAETPFLDLSMEQLAPLPPADVVIIAAAVARLGDCEADPQGSRRVNVDGTLALAKSYLERGSHVIFLSSDKVFDGTRPHRLRGEPTCPATTYGEQKAFTEAALGKLPGTAIVRLSKVLSPNTALLRGWQKTLAAGRVISPFEDLFLAPVTTNMVADLLERVVAERAEGIFHCTGAEDRSYVELARALAGHHGLDGKLIVPVTAPDENMPRGGLSRHTSLEMALEEARWGISAPCFDAVVADLV